MQLAVASCFPHAQHAHLCSRQSAFPLCINPKVASKSFRRLQTVRCCTSENQDTKILEENKGLPKTLIAGGAIGFGVAAFLTLRVLSGAPTFDNLERASMPLDTALQNGKPTVIEFYASWCSICRELLPDTLEVCSMASALQVQINMSIPADALCPAYRSFLGGSRHDSL